MALPQLDARLLKDAQGEVEVLPRLLQIALSDEHEAEVVLSPGDREAVVEQLVDRDCLLRVLARPNQIAKMLVSSPKVRIHLPEAAQVLKLASHLNGLRVVVDRFRPLVLNQVYGSEPAENTSLERPIGRL